MILGDLWKLTLEYVLPDGGTAQNVFHYVCKIADPGATDLDVLTAVLFELQIGWASAAGRINAGTQGQIAELARYDHILQTFSTTATLPMVGFDGTTGAEASPNGISVLLKFFTDLGRSQGRKYVPGVAETMVSTNTLDALPLADFVTMAQQWGLPHVVGVGVVTPGNFNKVLGTIRTWTSDIAVNALVAYQRRRAPGVGL